MGEEASTEGQSCAIASESRAVRVTSDLHHAAAAANLGQHDDHVGPEGLKLALDQQLALWPTETIVVTAAMPITTPSTVRPARILFLASAAGRSGP